MKIRRIILAVVLALGLGGLVATNLSADALATTSSMPQDTCINRYHGTWNPSTGICTFDNNNPTPANPGSGGGGGSGGRTGTSGGYACPETSLIFVECDENGNGILNLVQTIVLIVSGGVALLAVVGIIIAAIRYTTAAGNAAQATEARKMIINIVIGLAAYAMLAALAWFLGINWNAA